MSGKVNKSAAGKTGTTSEKKDDKATKDTPVPAKPAPVAPVITDDSQASQPAVAASDVASDPEPVTDGREISFPVHHLRRGRHQFRQQIQVTARQPQHFTSCPNICQSHQVQ